MSIAANMFTENLLTRQSERVRCGLICIIKARVYERVTEYECRADPTSKEIFKLKNRYTRVFLFGIGL